MIQRRNKPRYVFQNKVVYKNHDSTDDYDFIHKYFDEADINQKQFK